MTKSKSPRTWLGVIAVALIATIFISVAGWLPASPSDEIGRAVAAQGAPNAKQAKPDVFLDALASVLVAVDKKASTPYVEAAVKLRPELKTQIAETATEIYQAPEAGDTDTDRHRVSRHRRRCTICHHGYEDRKGVTLRLDCRAARRHLEQHPHDTRGPCPE